MIEMSVIGLAIDPRSSQPIVILNDQTKNRALPIWIGPAEARAISIALEKIKAKRPLTHELLLNVIHELGYKIEQVDINSLTAGTYCATIRLCARDASGGATLTKEIDARPSDAIALALAADVPIFASSQVMEDGAINILDPVDEAAEADEFKKFVSDLKASDFKMPGGGTVEPPVE